MTTYADLLAATGAHVRDGATVLRSDRFWTPGEAMDAIGDYHGLLDAIASHARRLLRPGQLGRVGLNLRRRNLPAILRAAIALTAGIEALTGDARPHPSQIANAQTPWARAARTMRAATDLVATQYASDGRPRSPDAALTTSTTLDAGLVTLGQLASTVLAQAEPLALRSIQAGAPKDVVARQLPGLEHLADIARELGDSPQQPARAHLDPLGQTPPQPRVDDPTAELVDRMLRLRQATWELTGDRNDALASLRTMAGLGITIHAHAAAFYGADLTTPDTTFGDHGTGALVRNARSWQHLHRALSQFAVLAPPDPRIHADALAAARLLDQLAPLGRSHAGAPPTSADRHLGAVLNGTVQIMADIAVHEGTTFDRLTHAGLLHIPARTLPRDLVTDHPELVAARLAGHTVPAPKTVTDQVADLYVEAARHPAQIRPAPAVTPAPAPQAPRGLAPEYATR